MGGWGIGLSSLFASAAKAGLESDELTARLKPCPDESEAREEKGKIPYATTAYGEPGVRETQGPA